MKKKLPAKDLELVRRVATKLRADMLQENDDDTLKAFCLDASRRLRDLLIKAGFKAWVVQGTFEIDNPDWSCGNEELTEAQAHHPLHYWVELLTSPRIVVDITSDQFNDEMEGDECTAVVVEPRRDLPRYRALRLNWQ
jgi:hypothetical protein